MFLSHENVLRDPLQPFFTVFTSKYSKNSERIFHNYSKNILFDLHWNFDNQISFKPKILLYAQLYFLHIFW